MLVPVELAPVEIRDVLWDDGVAWVATSSGADVYDEDGSLLAEVDDLPCSDVRVLGRYAGELTLGTECGAFQWHDGWQLLGRAAPVAAIVDGAVFYRSGRIFPYGDVGTAVVDAVDWQDGWAIATAEGRLVLDQAIVVMPGPVAELAVVDGELRIATHTGAVTVAADGTRVDLAHLATAAGEHWGTVDGALIGGDGERNASVRGAVVSMASGPSSTLIATTEGLWRLDADHARRLDEPTERCGEFVTGIERWHGRLVVATFDHGVCVETDDGWTRLQGLPSQMVNEVAVVDDALWVATSDGLARVDDAGIEVFGTVPDNPVRGMPGLNHAGVNDVTVRDGELWVADVLGPVRVRQDGRWDRYRWHVSGHSYQAVEACDTGEVWVASEDDGLAVLGLRDLGRRNGRSRWRQVNMLDGLPEDWVMDVACAGPGSAWVGTYRSGVGRIDADGWQPIVGLEGAWVQALELVGDDLWVGTADGLFVVRGDEVIRVGREDTRTLRAEEGRLWVGSRTGLSWIDAG